jgi:hypothetical protein
VEIKHEGNTSVLYDSTENVITTIEQDIVRIHKTGDIPLVHLKKLLWAHDAHGGKI